MKVLYYIFLIVGVLSLVDGIMALYQQTGGRVLGLELSHPVFGIYHFVLGAFLCFMFYRKIIAKK